LCLRKKSNWYHDVGTNLFLLQTLLSVCIDSSSSHFHAPLRLWT
jgi:hypothetical protein